MIQQWLRPAASAHAAMLDAVLVSVHTHMAIIFAGWLALFLLALFFSPVVAMVGSYPPITAPALVIVGAMMDVGDLGLAHLVLTLTLQGYSHAKFGSGRVVASPLPQRPQGPA